LIGGANQVVIDAPEGADANVRPFRVLGRPQQPAWNDEQSPDADFFA